ncbi:MAG: aminotransferase class IV [Eubacteriales bacterium]|nr:aminotransferase class IV [Eubacteriales bacterium]
MKDIGYYNGNIGELDKMQVPMLDRACYFADGLYEVAYVLGGKPYCLDEHLDRLWEGCKTLDIKPQFDKAQLKQIIEGLVRMTDSPDLQVYVQISRGCGLRRHEYDDDMQPNLWIMIRQHAIKDMSVPYRLVSMQDIRHGLCNVKSLNLLSNVLASKYASDCNADECVLIRDGIVKECSHSSIGLIKGGRLVFPVCDEHCLRGVSREKIARIGKEMGLCVQESDFGLAEMYEADEVIVCSSGAPCMRVVSLDGMKIGGRATEIVEFIQNKISKVMKDEG